MGHRGEAGAASTGRVEPVLVIVAPGQGAQSPGFLTPWLEDPEFRKRFEWLSTVASLDLVHYGTEADADEIRRTDIAQPLLVATGLVAALGIFPHPTDAFGKVSAVAGHSVGELTAAAGARVITAEQAMVLVRERGKAMAEAAAETPTGMTAVLGGDRENVLAVIEKHGLTAANDNGPGQVVAAGTMEQLQALADEPPEKARLAPLQRGRRVPHPPHGARRRRTSARWPGRCRCTTHAPASSPTRTARSSTTAATCCAGSSARSPARSAGTCAWTPSRTSASPASSRCRRPAP